MADKTPKRGRGRPALPNEERRVPRYTLRMTAAEYDLIDRVLGGEAAPLAVRALVREARRPECGGESGGVLGYLKSSPRWRRDDASRWWAHLGGNALVLCDHEPLTWERVRYAENYHE